MAYHARKVDKDFFKRWSAEMAYILGYFAADGTMVKHKNGGYFIEFHSTDKYLIQRTRSILKSNHAIGVRLPKPGQGNRKCAYRLQIGSKEIFSDLTKLGFMQNKSNVLAIPDLPQKYAPHFVRGYFDGDGCIYFKYLKFAARKHPRAIMQSLFTSGSKIFLQDLHTVLKNHGVKGGVVKTKHRNSGYELSFSFLDSLALYKFMYNTSPATGLYLPRKYMLFREAVQTMYPDLRV